MQVKFDEFSEEEFYLIYLFLVGTFHSIANDPHMYLKMAKDFLHSPLMQINASELAWVITHYVINGEE